MAPACGECASMATCLHRSTGDDGLRKVLADMQVPGSIHFHKTLAQRSQHFRFSQGKKLCLPVWFVKAHGDKFEDWVTLRTLSSTKTWRVRLRVARTASGAPEVDLMGGWSRFVLDNRLEVGDSLLFALNVDARSEFRVYIFSGGIDTPAGKKKLSDAEERLYQLSKVVTPSLQRSFAPQSGAKFIPSFRTRLVPYTYKRGQTGMEVPAQFVRAHGMPEQLPGVVELQGVHLESPVRTVTCRWYGQDETATPRLFFKGGWDAFAKENGLEVGEELQFTLTSHSFFVVRVVV